MKITTFFLSALLLSSCGSKSTFEPSAEEKNIVSENIEASPAPPPADMSLTPTTSMALEDKKSDAMGVGEKVSEQKVPEKIKKNADINITVDDYPQARAAVEKIVKSTHAFISGENEQKSTYSLSNQLVIRVANKDFDALVSNISGLPGHVNSKNIYTEDVTAQFIDISARLKSKKEVEQRYIELLSKAQKVGEILEVEEQLRVIREEIEAKEGELNYLNDQVDYSTINLQLHQDFEFTPTDEPGFLGRLGHAFGNGWKGFLGMIVGIVYVWPLWIVLGLVAYFLVKFIRRQLKK